MTDSAEQQIKDLLDRISQLETRIESLSVSIAGAAPKEVLDRLADIEKKMKRRAHHFAVLSQNFMDYRAEQGERVAFAFERIKGLEVTVFPHLTSDIESVYRVIGGDGVPAEPNPLDVRRKDNGLPDSASEI